jgi:hypothetical protein
MASDAAAIHGAVPAEEGSPHGGDGAEVGACRGEGDQQLQRRGDESIPDLAGLELKSVGHISPLREAQLLTYVHPSGCRVGLLLNFNTVALKLGIRRRIV